MLLQLLRGKRLPCSVVGFSLFWCRVNGMSGDSGGSASEAIALNLDGEERRSTGVHNSGHTGRYILYALAVVTGIGAAVAFGFVGWQKLHRTSGYVAMSCTMSDCTSHKYARAGPPLWPALTRPRSPRR